MKKLLLILLFSFSAQYAFSQIEKGKVMVGGSASFHSVEANTINYTRFYLTLAPEAGYFMANNFALGMRIKLISSMYKFNSIYNTEIAYFVNPFLRYYFVPSPSKINVFSEVSYGIGENNANGKLLKEFSVSAGPAFFITPNVALELKISYQMNSFEAKIISLSSGFQIHL